MNLKDNKQMENIHGELNFEADNKNQKDILAFLKLMDNNILEDKQWLTHSQDNTSLNYMQS